MGNLDNSSAVATLNPPLVERGCNSQKAAPGVRQPTRSPVFGRIGLHWLRGSIDGHCKAWLVDMMVLLFGSHREIKPYGVYKYDRQIVWPCGARVLYHSTSERSELTAGRITLDIPGQSVERLRSFDTFRFLCALWKRGFQASRVDVFFDDFRRIVLPGKLYALIYERSLFPDHPIRADFSGFQKIRHNEEGDKRWGIEGDVTVFGKRGSLGSGKCLRVYDKWLESDGENKAVRWELELSRKVAAALVRELVGQFEAGGVNAAVRLMAAKIGGCIDFVKRTTRVGDKNLERLERYGFWQTILSMLDRVKLVRERIIRSVEKTRSWVNRQVFGALQMLRKAYGLSDVLKWLESGIVLDDRIRPHHRRQIEEFQQGRSPQQSIRAAVARIKTDRDRFLESLPPEKWLPSLDVS